MTPALARCGLKNRTHALRISRPLIRWISYGDVDVSPYLCRTRCARRRWLSSGDGCVVIVLAHRKPGSGLEPRPVWVRGVGFAIDSPTLESRDWVEAQSIRGAAAMAYRQAESGIRPRRSSFSKWTTAVRSRSSSTWSLGFLSRRARRQSGARCTQRQQDCAVNVSGGSLGMGPTLEASGLYRLAELVHQIRGEAGAASSRKRVSAWRSRGAGCRRLAARRGCRGGVACRRITDRLPSSAPA